MEYGSLTNLLTSQSTKNAPIPEVGMGATGLYWTDREAYTIVELLYTKAGKLKGFLAQQDTAKRKDTNGMSECQDYTYIANPEAEKIVVKLNSKGQWKSKACVFAIGYREKYRDYSF